MLEIVKIEYENNSLLITLEGINKTMNVIFDNPLIFSLTDEVNRVNYLNNRNKYFKNFYEDNEYIHVLKNSEFLNYFHRDSLSIYEKDKGIMEFIVGNNTLVSVITFITPKVEFRSS